MNEHMKLQIKTMLVSVQTFQTGMRLGALKDDGKIDKDEAKILNKAKKASDKYEKALKRLISE